MTVDLNLQAKKKKDDDDLRIVGNVVPLPDPPPEVKKGKRGGRYTEDVTKDGSPNRRYCIFNETHTNTSTSSPRFTYGC